jgi:polyisoprenoid-binding protein YceI
MGFSTYTGQFVNVQAELSLNPSNPSASTLTATIPLTDVMTGSNGLDGHLQSPDFFDTANHPTATFVSRSVEVDSDDPNEATVIGDLTLRGVTKSVVVEVEFNQAGPSMGNTYKAGFDGEATIKRSDFGITYGIPMGLGDDVKLHIEGEFTLQQ